MLSSSEDVNLGQNNLYNTNNFSNHRISRNNDKQHITTKYEESILQENTGTNESQLKESNESNESKTDINLKLGGDDYESERMQLNPSTDFYNDYDNEKFGNTGTQNKYYESLPEAKSLIFESHKVEEDMGYDEDDEQLTVTIEKTTDYPIIKPNFEKNFNENEKEKNNYNQFRADNNEKNIKNQQKFITENANRDLVDTRESSGNFANDDEDYDIDTDRSYGDYDTDNDENSKNFFNNKRKSNSRYFRKNTNDAIKIISTPLGKVGIVYQPNENSYNDQENVGKKPKMTFTDFDALSPDPESSHRLASSHPKITPVLTPDGKVALLYRGDSENSKYEPIRNLTNKFQQKNVNFDNNTVGNTEKNAGLNSTDNETIDSEPMNLGDSGEEENIEKSDFSRNVQVKTNEQNLEPIPQFSEVIPTTGSFIIRPTDTILPMINKPLSEVLGIKKNQFKQFRIKDIPTTTETNSRSLAEIYLDHSETTNLHFLTKVNLADYSTATKSKNTDIDFSRDNTMLDERSRQRELNHEQSNNNDVNKNGFIERNFDTIANEEILAKTEVVNLAVIPHFDEELQQLQRLHEHDRRHYRQRHRSRQSTDDLSGVHCIMQAMMGIAAISTVFGMLGTFFKQRILDQIRLMHW